jgi:hypothetical protein
MATDTPCRKNSAHLPTNARRRSGRSLFDGLRISTAATRRRSCLASSTRTSYSSCRAGRWRHRIRASAAPTLRSRLLRPRPLNPRPLQPATPSQKMRRRSRRWCRDARGKGDIAGRQHLLQGHDHDRRPGGVERVPRMVLVERRIRWSRSGMTHSPHRQCIAKNHGPFRASSRSCESEPSTLNRSGHARPCRFFQQLGLPIYFD